MMKNCWTIAGLTIALLGVSCSVARAHGDEDHAGKGKAAPKTASPKQHAERVMNGPQDEFLKAVRFDQKLNAQVPMDARFRDDNGKSIAFKDVFNGKPIVLVPIYYKCATNCSLVLQEAVRSLKEVSFTAGQEFNLVAISIDARETPEIARAEKEKYLAQYKQGTIGKGWHLLTGDEKQILRLTESIGFGFKYDPKTDQFAHPDGAVVLTPQGKVARYFYGITFPTRDMKFALMEASSERIGSPVEQLLLTCFHYDPITNKYSVAIMGVVRIAFVALVLCGLSAIGVSVWREKKNVKPTLDASA